HLNDCRVPQFWQSRRMSAEAPEVIPKPARIASIDALRGFVMFTMIFVNDLAGAPKKIVPDWLVHFSDRHQHGSGMTFVDLVFPAFIFIVGMSIPFALGARAAKGEPVWKTFGHVAIRTLSLLFIGILMVHETPNSELLDWPGERWCTLMYLAGIFAFCSVSPCNTDAKLKLSAWKISSLCLRAAGLATLVWLAFAFRGDQGRRTITLASFHLDTDWYGILGLIGWAYLVVSVIYLVFRGHRTALLGSLVLLMCLFAAG